MNITKAWRMMMIVIPKRKKTQTTADKDIKLTSRKRKVKTTNIEILTIAMTLNITIIKLIINHNLEKRKIQSMKNKVSYLRVMIGTKKRKIEMATRIKISTKMEVKMKGAIQTIRWMI